MVKNFKSVFDIIGPILVGPSSSHTAGAVKIGQEANTLFGGVPKKVTVHYYQSFAQTHRGHGTDYAIAAGILGYKADDLRIPDAPEIAKKRGVDIRFVEEFGDSPINHPNTAVLDMYDDSGKRVSQLSGCSIGGGAIEIRRLIIHDTKIYPAGPIPIILYIDKEKNQDNEIPVANFIQKNAPFIRKQVYNAEDCDIYEYDIRNYIHNEFIKELKDKFKTVICL